jgi:PhnB protein
VAKRSRFEELDQAVQAMLSQPAAGESSVSEGVEASLVPLLNIARELRDLPSESFRERLKSDLQGSTFMASSAIRTESAVAVRPTATPRLRIKNAGAAVEFYKKAFGARETMRFEVGGQIAHAEIEIGNSVVKLGEEAPEYGFPGPQTLGGSPVGMQLDVEDVDAAVARAVAAGARPVAPVTDQFYGDRTGSVADPFGYTWFISTRKEELSVEEMHRRFAALEAQTAESRAGVSPIPQGYHTLTPYLVVQDALGLIEFVKRTFGAEEVFRTTGSAGGVHAEMRIGDSMLMMGGGGAGLAWRGEAMPSALHVYVKDVDSAHQRAVEAGAVTIQPPADQEYGERGGSLKDAFGNHWYIATAMGENYIPKGLRAVNPYLHPLRAEPVIQFLKRALGAEEREKYASPDGVIHHATVKIGDSVLEMGEAQGPYQPMPTMFYVYVPDVDAMYSRAMNGGATSMSAPADQTYGDRTASVKDPFGNQWYLATHVRDVNG